MKKIYILISTGFLFVSGFSQNITIPPPNISDTENYIYTREYLAETSVSSNSVPQVQSVTYFDGLGREKQKINIKASPLGKDVVTKVEYDALGRQLLDFLPMPQQNTTNGGIYSSATTPYTEFVGNPLYGGTAPFYSKNEIEFSPLNRPLSSMAPGDWNVNNKKVTTDYKFNIAGEVKKYSAVTAWSNGATSCALSVSGSYAANQLYKTITTDEDNNVSVEFKDRLGQIVLVRKVVSATENADTYYVYNEYHDLAYVLSPLFSDKNKNATNVLLTTSTDINELCYQYRYDEKSRLAEKKLPGKGWEYFVYDNQDRLVMTQDANLGADKQWLFTKYDQFGRVAYTGIYTSSQDYGSTGRNFEQGQVNGKSSNNVARTTSGFAQPGVLVYYDNDTAKNYPNTITKLLSVNYFDTYPTGTPTIPTSILSQDVLPQTGNLTPKGLPTASYINNVENNGWTKNYVWYDTKGRIIGLHTINHLGGYTKTQNLLDFAGVPKKTNTYHKRRNADTELVIQEEFEYDNQNRLLTHTHEVVGKTSKELLVENHYNEIGQLDWKKVGGVSGSYLQKVDLSYNIRGWMTGINSGDIIYSQADEFYSLTGGKLFGYNIRYNNPENPLLGAARYNGNIAEVDWISRDVSLKRYGYQYDGLNRLLKGNYQDPGTTLPETHANDEALTYDLNGNIKTLVRVSPQGKRYTPTVIDDLGYQYTGNRVTNITDASGNSSGYEGGGQLMGYDANGNTTAMPDKNISAIAYNFLNLPKQINQNANVTNYYYRADGMKIKKKFVLTNSLGTEIINTEYLDGFQYSTPNTDPIRKALEESDDATMAASKAGEEEAFAPDLERQVVAVVDPGTPEVDNMILSFFPTAEGYYDFENLRYIYQYKDHLGNVRVSYVKNGNDLEIRDRNDYYPFGMSFLKPFGQVSVYDPMAIPYNYKYNGKELQETGMYDHGARFYMPDLGRFGTIDPRGEYTKESYSYVWNNPIKFLDPTGMEGESSDSGGGGETGEGGGGMGEAGGGDSFAQGGTGKGSGVDSGKGSQVTTGCCPGEIAPNKPGGENNPHVIEEVKLIAMGRPVVSSTVATVTVFALTLNDALKSVVIPQISTTALTTVLTRSLWALPLILNGDMQKSDDSFVAPPLAKTQEDDDGDTNGVAVPGSGTVTPIDGSATTPAQVLEAKKTYGDEAEHTKGARPSTKTKHEKGQSRKGRDKGGEKGDARRTRYK
ncbi:DUF6443 domain-containing protein [Chryseobacterium sp. SC28]|uniref:DUF6443 domain-containing protein n=1 Tax=Chryseobacterium sp. SC28 TaxID=2268028 RepID=UPI000F654C96|nr:DUF6443 domain-containing protein [Chryseobacterium sp. SC28]RRQ46200.1 RHS repeat-associated core domain-containing protein [Chryseobacterium sp. SC28]